MDFSIKLAAKRSGLSEHTIRAWERRYGAVKPNRSSGQHRRYSEEEVERLGCLRRATEEGHNISDIASLSTADLKQLLHDVSPAQLSRASGSADERGSFLEQGLHAVQTLNAAELEAVLNKAAVAVGHQGLLRQVLAPLVQAVGDLWQEGTITAAHEHFASALVRSFLTSSARPFAAGPDRPKLVVGTPAGQLHELGAVLVAATAVNSGWSVVYLGASLPAAEIAGAALQSAARGVALSLVYPEDDPGLPQELQKLRGYLPNTAILVGGRAAPAYGKSLEGVGALACLDLAELDQRLAELRRS